MQHLGASISEADTESYLDFEQPVLVESDKEGLEDNKISEF
jgi:hypothetical protein